MSDVTSLFNYAELAVASYANLVTGDTLLAANRNINGVGVNLD